MEAEEEPRKLRRPSPPRRASRCVRAQVPAVCEGEVSRGAGCGRAAVEPAAASPLPPRRLAGGFPRRFSSAPDVAHALKAPSPMLSPALR